MKRKIISIDKDLCNGCEKCVNACPEGAIQMINGKAVLVSENYCDGLGACIGDCPVGAITIEKREAKQYDELTVIQNIAKQGPDVIKAHLDHLKEHGETGYLKIAEKYLQENGFEQFLQNYKNNKLPEIKFHGCPGSRSMDFSQNTNNRDDGEETGERQSHLQQWPVQLHLISPEAEYFKNADVLLAADCTAFAVADFHKNYLKGKRLAIACPKLDKGLEIYKEKITRLIENSYINTLTVLIMQVPCCSGLLHIAKSAVQNAKSEIPLKYVVVGLKGNVIKQEWVNVEKEKVKK